MRSRFKRGTLRGEQLADEPATSARGIGPPGERGRIYELAAFAAADVPQARSGRGGRGTLSPGGAS